MLTNDLLKKIIALVDRHVASAPATSAADKDKKCLLVANEALMIACRITTDAKGYHHLFLYDQITSKELTASQTSFLDINKAIAAAYAAVDLKAPEIVSLAS
jgi:hypothetical protein